MKKVAIYARVSTGGQTTENQVSAIKTYCDQRGLQIFKIYEDHGISGAQHDRPALDEMIADAGNNRFEILVCWKIDRIARSVVHLLEVLATLRRFNIGFCSITEQIDTSSPQGRMLLTFLGGIAEFERELCKERIKSGLTRAKANGVRLGRPRVGFDIQRAMEMRDAGQGYKQIAKALGIPRTTLYRSLRAIPKTIA